MHCPRLLTAAWLAVLLTLRASADPATLTNLSERFAPILPCPALATVAQSNQIPLTDLEPPGAGNKLTPGDSLTALVAFFENDHRQSQWMLRLQAVELDAKEREKAAKPAKPWVIHTSTGKRLEFVSSPAQVQLRTFGPFVAVTGKRKAPKAQDQSARVTLNQDYLAAGLDQAAAVILRLNEGRTPDMKGSFAFGAAPFPEAEVQEGKKLAEALHITDEEERGLAGLGPALMSYFGIVQETTGLDDILFKLIDLPSLWSIVRNGGVKAHFRVESKAIKQTEPGDWGLPAGTVVYHLPMVLELNHQPALNVILVVTSPRPPLLACAGVIGVVAARPGDKERHLLVRIVSAQRTADLQQESQKAQ